MYFVFFRTMMDLFSTKAERSLIISHLNTRTKEPHYSPPSLKPTRSSTKPYQYRSVTLAHTLKRSYPSYTINRKVPLKSNNTIKHAQFAFFYLCSGFSSKNLRIKKSLTTLLKSWGLNWIYMIRFWASRNISQAM